MRKSLMLVLALSILLAAAVFGFANTDDFDFELYSIRHQYDFYDSATIDVGPIEPSAVAIRYDFGVAIVIVYSDSQMTLSIYVKPGIEYEPSMSLEKIAGLMVCNDNVGSGVISLVSR